MVKLGELTKQTFREYTDSQLEHRIKVLQGYLNDPSDIFNNKDIARAKLKYALEVQESRRKKEPDICDIIESESV